MGKQGLKGTQSDVYLYQELDSNVSVAVGLEDANDVFKISVSSIADADPGGAAQISIDPAAAGDITFDPQSTGNIVIDDGDLSFTQSVQDPLTVQQIVFSGDNRMHFFLNNVFIGQSAGNFTMTPGVALFNVGIGSLAMQSITTGPQNVGIGNGALQDTTVGQDNVMVGYVAGSEITTGTHNVGVGSSVFQSAGSGIGLLTGTYNVGIGANAGFNYRAAESDNIMINNGGVLAENNTMRIGAGTGAGQQQLNRAFISGIRGITTGNADAIAVLVDSADQLGTVSSSIRHKENIEDIGATTDKIYDLRPVSFNYKIDDTKRRQYGLIAEEVKEIYPDLVVNDEEGLPLSIKYQDLPILLLNEIQRLKKEITALKASMPCHT